MAFNRASVSKVVPKAGMITMSSLRNSLQSISMRPCVSWMKRSPRLSRSAFTSGLWIIWLSK